MKFNRRSFLSNSCKSCASLVLLSAVASSLESCSSLVVYKTGTKNDRIILPLLEMNLIDKKIVRASDLAYDILLVKKENTYKALVLKCTHEDWLLSAGAKSINCTAHGSVFDFDGKVVEGPANLALISLPVSILNDSIIINIKSL